MSHAAIDATVRGYLCQSFSALVHGYAGVAALHDGKTAAFEETENGILVEVEGTQLTLDYDSSTGTGEWRIQGPFGVYRQGSLEFHSDGTLALDGLIMEMDHAAIDLSGLLKKFWCDKRGEKP